MNNPNATAEQRVMERRFSLPYNWMKGEHTRHIRQKNGLWAIARRCAGSLRGVAVLDAGCGDGWYSAKMLAEGARVSGIDYSDRAIAFARDILPQGEFHTASIAQLPFKDGSFDVVFSFQVIEHLPPAEVEAAIREIARVTKRGGRMIVTVPSVVRPKSDAHFQHFTQSSLSELFRPYVSEWKIQEQDLHTPLLWVVERLIQNRFYTLESVGTWFNQSMYLRRYNETTTGRGYNLVFSGRKS